MLLSDLRARLFIEIQPARLNFDSLVLGRSHAAISLLNLLDSRVKSRIARLRLYNCAKPAYRRFGVPLNLKSAS